MRAARVALARVRHGQGTFAIGILGNILFLDIAFLVALLHRTGHEVLVHARRGPTSPTIRVFWILHVCCNNCNSGKDNYCEEGIVLTYNSYEYGTKNITYGGYSKSIVVKENYVISIPFEMDMSKAAPLLCAGITTYSPLRHFKINKSHKVGIAGLGGLGHMGLKFAASFGADVVVFSTSDSKKEEAFEMGANHFVNINKPGDVREHMNSCDYILDTVSANRDMGKVFSFLKTLIFHHILFSSCSIPFCFTFFQNTNFLSEGCFHY